MADGYARLGAEGVVLIDQEYMVTDGAVDNAQNAELVMDEEKGGDPSMRKRGGIVPLGSAFADDVTAMFELRLVSELP